METRTNSLSPNHLESGAGWCKPYRKPYREPKVTIAIGLISKQKEVPQIIMASDSQSTYGAAKRINPNKISIVAFADADVLVAQHDPYFEFGWAIAVSVVEKVIENIDGCGAPAWSGIAYPMPKELSDRYELAKRPYNKTLASMVERPIMDLLASELKTAEIKLAKKRKNEIQTIIETVSKKHFTGIQAQVKMEMLAVQKEMKRRGMPIPPETS
jgi:hypothetical protein